jgi:hypothetical protein
MDANPDYVMKFLQGLEYPAESGRIAEHARTAGADAWIQATLDNLPSQQFDSEADLRAAIEDVEVDRPADKGFTREHDEMAANTDAGRSLGGGTGRATQ